MNAGFLPAGVIQALVAGLIGLIVGLALRRQDWARDRQDQAANETVKLIQDMATKLARASEAMSWLTWRAANDAKRVTKDSLNDYEMEIHSLLPEIAGAHAALAAISPDAAAAMDLTVAQLDGRCAAMSAAVAHARKHACEIDCTLLAEQFPEAAEFKAELTKAIKGASGKVLDRAVWRPRLKKLFGLVRRLFSRRRAEAGKLKADNHG